MLKLYLNNIRKKYGMLNNNGSAGKKWSVESTLREHVQGGLKQLSKLCLNLFVEVAQA